MACDFFSKEVWTLFGKVTCHVLFFIHLGTLRVWVSPPTARSDQAWTDQARRMKELEKENVRLKKVVADLALDNSILKEAASGNF